jgi:hypothetical protein
MELLKSPTRLGIIDDFKKYSRYLKSIDGSRCVLAMGAVD